MMQIIDVGKDFSRYPAGRTIADGQYSGESFRIKILEPIIKNKLRTILVMDNTAGYGSSFLQEAFGGLVESGHKPSVINDLIHIKSTDKSLILEIQEYIRDAR